MTVRRVAIGTASNAAGRGVGLLAWFFLTPFILHHLGPGGYGLWTLATALLGFGFLLDLGLAGAIVKFVAEDSAHGDLDRARALLRGAVRIYLALGLLTIVLALAVAAVADILFGIPPRDVPEAQATIVLVGVGVGLSVAGTPVMAVLRGLQRFDLYNAVLVASTLATALVTVGVLAAGGGLVAMVASHVPVIAAAQVAAVLLVRRTAPWTRDLRRSGRRHDTGRLVRFSGALFAMDASGRLQTRADELVIAAFLPVAMVTPYALARRLAELPQSLVDQFVKVLMPLASELEATAADARLRTALLVSVRTALAVYVPAVLVLLVFADVVLETWVGAGYVGAAPIVEVLAVAVAFRALSWPTASLLTGIGRHHRVAVLSVASGVANLALSIALIGPLGVIGVAWGTLIPTVIEAVIVLGYGARVLGIDTARVLREAVAPALLPAIPAGAVLIAVDALMQPTGILFVVPSVLCGATYLMAYLGGPSTGLERTVLRRALRSIRTRRSRVGDAHSGGS